MTNTPSTDDLALADEREAIAQIINPELFVEYDLLVKQGTVAENGKPWAQVVFGTKIERLLEKAGAIIALRTSPHETATPPAGEPVAFVPVHPRHGPLWSDTFAAGSEVHRTTSYERMALYATPQPQEPACREALDKLCVVEADLEILRGAATEACDLLAEKVLGSPARSPGHNARLRLERALRTMPSPANSTASPGGDVEIIRLRDSIAAIQKATVEGRVCDDVAWFDGITTLHDFCDQVLNGPDSGVPAQDGAARREVGVLAERALSQYDKTIDLAKDDKALSDSGRESIIRDCLAAKAAIRSFAPALSALSVSVTAGREEIIEQCAKVADRQAETWAAAFGGGAHEHIAMSMQEECETIAKAIRALTGSSS